MPRNLAALNAAPGVNIDVAGLALELEKRAVDALNTTLIFTHARAQKYAPVRAIFGRTRRGKAYKAIAGIAHKSDKPTTAEVMRAYRRRSTATWHPKAFATSLGPRPRRIDVPEPTYSRYTARELDRAGIPYNMSAKDFTEQRRVELSQLGRGPTYGSNNSLVPVNRSKGETVAGDMRQWRAGKLLPVATVVQIRGGKPARVDQTGDNFLTKRGSYEVATGRAAWRKADARVGEPLRIGGALRNSIVLVKASSDSIEGGKVMGYVRAGGDGVDYAGYQEFGTRHNRAQPFLRPALYESRTEFKRNVSNALKGQRVRTH